MLRPCPVLDNPGRLTDIVERSGAKSTDYQKLESAKEFSDKAVFTVFGISKLLKNRKEEN